MPRSPTSQRTSLPAGVKAVNKRLADGSTATYYYLRSNWTRLPHPEDPRFATALDAARQAKTGAPKGKLAALIEAYRRSPEFTDLAPKTKYNRELAFLLLERLSFLDPATIRRSHLMDLRDLVAKERGPGAANSFLSCMSTFFAWATDREKLEFNPATRLKKLPGGTLSPWSDDDLDTALTKLPEHMRRCVILALYTGQRRGDLAAMTWSQYDGASVKLRPRKTNRKGRPVHEIVVPVHPALKRELDSWKQDRSSVHILLNGWKRPWKPDAMSNAFQRWLGKLGVEGLNVHGLRKMAAARLADAGCSTHEIAAVTGHSSLAMIELYTRSANQKRLAKAAIRRLETGSQ